MNQLQAGQVRRAIARFKDYGRDLLASGVNTFDDRLRLFVRFCETDPTISRVHHQLLGVPGVDVGAWYAECTRQRQATFPIDAEQRLALMYRALRAISTEEIRFLDFAVSLFPSSSSKIDHYIHAFNEALSRPMLRELEYRLDDIVSGLPGSDAERIGTSVIQVINNTGTFVQQVAQGDGSPVMTARLEAGELLPLIRSLHERLKTAELAPAERQASADVVNAMEEEAQSATPRTGVLKALLASLPHVESIANVVNTIRAMLGA